MFSITLQDKYPYWTGYSIAKINIDYSEVIPNTIVPLYFIQCPVGIMENGGMIIDGFLYFSLMDPDNTDWDSLIKSYFTEYSDILITYGCDIGRIKSSKLLDGTHMFMSENLYNLIDKLEADDAWYFPDKDVVSDITELSHDEVFNRDLFHFIYINEAIASEVLSRESNIYTDAELSSFASTFFNIIKKRSSNNDTSTDTVTDKIYSAVIDYYIKYKADEAITLMDLILSSSYSYTPSNTVTSSCGCSSSTASSSLTDSCAYKYDSAMQTWLLQMMQDITYFYNKYFYTETKDEETGKTCYKPNTDLIDALTELIDEFKAAGYDLSFSTDTDKFTVCNCKSNSSSSSDTDCNYSVLDNFKTLLLYIKDNNTEGNENKMRAYGAAFAGILYKMYF